MSDIEYDPILELADQLHLMQIRWKRVLFVRGLLRTLMVALIAVTGACVLDYFVELPLAGRWLLSCMVYLAIGAYGYWCWVRPVLKPMTSEEVAWLVEQTCPGLNEKLISSVELQNISHHHVSLEMVAWLLEEANEDLSMIAPQQAFPLTWRTFRVPLLLAVFFIGALFVPAFQLPQLISRVALPSYRDAGIGPFRLVLRSPSRIEVIEGETVEFIVAPTEADVNKVSLYLRDSERQLQRLDMSRAADGKTFVYQLTNVYNDFEFWAKSGKVSTAVRNMTVVKRPKVEYFEITTRPPAYTGIKPSTTRTTTAALKALANTQVDLRLHASKPLSAAELIVGRSTLPMVLGADQLEATCSFEVIRSGSFRVFLRDREGLGNPGSFEYEITVVTDEVPKLLLREPAHDLYLNNDDTVDLEWFANDDYGVVRQELRYRVNGRGTQSLQLSDSDRRYQLDLTRLELNLGDEVDLHVRAWDGAGQAGESVKKRITIIAGRGLQGANEFVTRVQLVRSQLADGQLMLNEIEKSITAVQSGQSLNVAGAEDLDHSYNMLVHGVDRLDQQLLAIQHNCGRLRDTGFFPGSHAAAELIRLRLRHNRVFRLPKLADVNTATQVLPALRRELASAARVLQDIERRSQAVIIDAVGNNVRRTLDEVAKLDSRKSKSRPTLVRQIRDKAIRLARGFDAKAAAAMARIDPRKDRKLQKFRAAFSALHADARRLADDHRHTERLLKTLQKELPDFRRDFSRTARNIELYDSETDWRTVNRVMVDYHARPARLADQFADDQLVARVLATGIELKSVKHVQEVLDHLDTLARHHDLLRLQAWLVQFAEQLARTEDQVRRLIASRQGKQDIRKLLQSVAGEQQWHAQLVLDFPIGRSTLERSRPLGAVVHQILACRGHLTSFTNFTRQSKHSQALSFFERAGDAAAAARRRLQQQRQAAAAARELSRKALTRYVESNSRLLQDTVLVLEEMAEAAEDLNSRDQRRLESIKLRLDRVSRQLLQRALAEIAQDSGDIAGSRARLVIAAGLREMQQSEVQVAVEILDAVEEDIERGRAGNPEAPELGLDWRREQRSFARRQLERAASELRQLLEMYEAIEASERGELSLQEEQTRKEQVARAANELIGAELRADLDTLELVRLNHRRIRRLAQDAGRKNANAEDIASGVDRIGQGVADAISPAGRRRLARLAQHQITVTRNRTAALLAAVRRARATTGDPGPEARREAADSLLAGLEQLQRDLGRLEGFRLLLQQRLRPASEIVNAAVVPGLTQAADKLRRDQSAAAEADGAIAGLKQLSEALADYAVEAASTTADLAVREPAPTAADVDRRQAVQGAMDSMKHDLALAEIAFTHALQLREKIAAQQDVARKLLDTIPLSMVTREVAKMINRNQEQFDRMPPAKQAQALRALAAKLRKSPEQQQAFTQMASDLSRLQTDYARARELQATAKAASGRVSRQATVVARNLDRLAQLPLAENSRQLTQHLKENLQLNDYDAARRNFRALERNVAELPIPVLPIALPQAPPADTRDRGPLTHRELLGLDWNARHGIQIELARMRARPYRPVPGSIAAALSGNYREAVDLAVADDAEADFRRAAARQDLDLSAYEPPAAFVTPRRPLPAAAADQLRNRARRQPEEFLQDTAQRIAAARELLKQVAAAAARKDQKQARAKLAELKPQIDHIEAARHLMAATEFSAHHLVRGRLTQQLSPGKFDAEAATGTIKFADAALATDAARLGVVQRRLQQQQALQDHCRSVVRRLRESAAAEDRLQAQAEQLRRRLADVAAGVVGLDAVQNNIQDKPPTQQAELIRQFAVGLPAAEEETGTQLKRLADRIANDKAGVARRRQTQAARRRSVAGLTALTAAVAADLRPAADAAAKQLERAKADVAAGRSRDAAGVVEALVDALRPMPLVRPPVPFIQPAFDAAAGAVILRNRDALIKAAAGDYRGASRSMLRLSRKLEGRLQSVAEAAATGFERARVQQKEELPPQLREVLNSSAQLQDQLPAAVVHALRDFDRELRVQNFTRATVELQDALALIGDTEDTAMRDLAGPVQAAAETREQAIRQLNPDTRKVLNDVAAFVTAGDALTQYELGQARRALQGDDPDIAEAHLRIAAEGVPTALANQLRVLADCLQRPPQSLTPQQLADIDWNARRGILRSRVEAGNTDRYGPSQLALRGDYTGAAIQARGSAQHDFAKAAERQLDAGDALPQLPRAFRQPRPRLTPAAEIALARAYDAQRAAFVRETLDHVRTARDHAKTASQQAGRKKQHAEARRRLTELQEMLGALEARRAVIGATDHAAYRLAGEADTLLQGERRQTRQARERLEQLQRILAHYELELKLAEQTAGTADRLEAAVVNVEQAMQQLAAQLDQRRAAGTATAPKQLDAAIGRQQKLAAQALAELAKFIRQTQSPLFDRIATAADRLRQDVAKPVAPHRLQQQLRRLTQSARRIWAPAPTLVPMNEEAYDASATAVLLNNVDALNRARRGDYAAAAASMTRLVQTLSPGPARDLAAAAADKYTEAATARLERLPAGLASRLRRAAEKRERLPTTAALAMDRAAQAAAGRDYIRAAAATALAIRHCGGKELTFLQHFGKDIDSAWAAAGRRRSEQPPEIREAADDLDRLQQAVAAASAEVADTIVLELQLARRFLARHDYRLAARQLRQAAEAMTTDRQLAARALAAHLLLTDWARYGRMNDTAREAVRLLQKDVPEARRRARAGDYSAAARAARQAGEERAAAVFQDAAETAREVLGDDARRAADLLADAAQAAAKDLRRKLEQARRQAAANRPERALTIVRQTGRDLDDQVQLAARLEAARREQDERRLPLRRAAQQAAAGEFAGAAALIADLAAAGAIVTDLQQAETMVDDGIREALEAAAAESDVGRRKTLQLAARQAMANDLEEAIKQATAAGQTGTAIATRFADARDTGRRAADHLKELADAAVPDNMQTRRASEIIAERQAYLGQTKTALTARERRLQAEKETLTAALTQIRDGRFETAADNVAATEFGQAAAARLELAAQQLKAAGQAAADAVFQGNAEQQKALQEAANADTPAKGKAAATQAGDLGKPAARLFAAAGDDAGEGERILQDAIKELDEALAQVRTSVTDVDKQAAAYSSMAEQVNQGAFAVAAAAAKQLTGGMYDARRAQELLAEEVLRQQAQADISRGNLRPDPTINIPPEQRRLDTKLVRVLADLTNAGELLTDEKPAAQAAQFEQAAAELSIAARLLARQAAKQAARRLDADDAGEINPRALELMADIPAGDLSGAWFEPDLELEGSSGQSSRNLYSPYYRKANRRYLEWISRESRKWQDR